MNFLVSALPLLGSVLGFNIPPKLLALLPTLIKAAPQIQAAASQGATAVNNILTQHPDLLPILKQVGTSLFPDVAPDLQHIAAAQAVFDPAWIEEAQRLLNSKAHAGIGVDGIVGPLTKAATKAFQAAHQPAAGPVDGWPGTKTMAVLRAA